MEQCPLNKLDNVADSSSSSIMRKINTMVNSNIFTLVIMCGILIVLFLMLSYFVFSLYKNISVYLKYSKSKDARKGSDSILDKAADNESYEILDETTFGNPSTIEPKKFMPKPKRTFIKKLEQDNVVYNKEKTDYLIKELQYPENDDLVNDSLLYKQYDNYTYNYNNDE
jgi:hypothetical protein